MGTLMTSRTGQNPLIIAFSGKLYMADASGVFDIDNNDILAALQAGFSAIGSPDIVWYSGTPVIGTSRQAVYAPVAPPLAAGPATIVALTNLANGPIAITAQPDVPRDIEVTVDPGGVNITAATLTINYTDNFGASQSQALDISQGGTAPYNAASGIACQHITSVSLASLAGGSSPKIEIGTTNVLCVPFANSNVVSFAILEEQTDGVPNAAGSIQASTGKWTPTIAPNGAHNYMLRYLFLLPVVGL